MFTMYINASNITPSYTHNISYLVCPGAKLHQRYAATPYEHVHPTPYYLQKDWSHSMQETPNKGPIRHLKKHILKYDKDITTIAAASNHTHQLNL